MKNGVYTHCLVLLVALGFPCDSRSAHVEGGFVCESVAIQTSIRDVSGRRSILFTVSNPTAKSVELTKFYFGGNMLRLRAATNPGGKELAKVVPLISPGVKNIVIEPGGKVFQEVDLDSVFPDLGKALVTEDVVISWELQVKPKSSCFSNVVETSMTLEKAK